MSALYPDGMSRATDAIDDASSAQRCRDFAQRHRPGQPLFLPNAWDHASAAVLAAAGYDAVGTTSLGVAAAAGKPDATGAAAAETLDLAERLRGLPVLLTVDLEGGFSDDPAAVADLAERIAGLGAVGINLEDGRPDGSLSPVDEFAAKIVAVKERVPALFLNARTDAYWLQPAGVDPGTEAGSRGHAYAAAGADGFFAPGIADLDEITALVSSVAVPLNVLYLPGRHTVADLAAAGAARISLGSLLFRAALGYIRQVTDEIAQDQPATGRPVPPSYADVQAMAAGR